MRFCELLLDPVHRNEILDVSLPRRTFLSVVPAGISAALLPACSAEGERSSTSADSGNRGSLSTPNSTGEGFTPNTDPPAIHQFFMPAEEAEHERTWMCWPSNEDIWGDGLEEVQNNIAEIARAIAAFEPVTMLVRPEEMEAVADLLGEEIELLEAPVDDLWARDTLPAFLITAPGDPRPGMAAGRVRFNGWGGKQTHDGDATLAELLATHLDIPLHDWGLVGEGGGFEVDGAGTVLAAESSWVNDNRNPGKTRDEIEAGLLSLLGADRMIWVDGLAGHDITDGHIDTLARFASETTIVVDAPAFPEEDNVWVDLAARTKELIEAAVTSDGEPYEVIEITQPGEPRGTSDGFLASYMNYYVCNGAVIAPEFGDEAADAAARELLAELFPDREVVQINIDGLAAGGGGIHCATQQQPKLRGE